MMKKMCPVCDQPVNEMNYCKFCRKFVKHPYLNHVDFYLNERHPSVDTNCEYHYPNLEADHHGNRAAQGNGNSSAPGHTVRPENPAGSGMRPPYQPQGGSSQSPYPRSVTPVQPSYQTVKPMTSQSNSGAIIAGIIIVVGICVMATLFAAMKSRSSYYSDYSTDYGFEEDYTTMYEDLTEDEVKAAGVNCDGYTHFPIDGSELVNAMEAHLTADGSGYTIDSIDEYSDNYIYKPDDGESISYYDTVKSYTLVNARSTDDTYEYLDVNYDTATGEIHGFQCSIRNGDAACAYLSEFLTLAEESSGISQDESVVELVSSKVKDVVAQMDNYYDTKGIFNIEVYSSEDGIYIDVSYNDPETASEL